MKQTFTLDEVQAAFQRLEGLVAASGVEAECLWALHAAVADCLQFLTGNDSPAGDGPAADELERAAGRARTVEDFDAAVLRLLGTFDNRPQVEMARIDIDAVWRPSPAGNEAMLAALDVFAQKVAGALGRGASRSEAELFALMEARRVYRQLVGGGS